LSPARNICLRRVAGWLAIVAWLFASPVTADAFEICFGADGHFGIEVLHDGHGTTPAAGQPSLSEPADCSDVALLQPNAPQAQFASLPRPAAFAESVAWPPPLPASTDVRSSSLGAASPPATALLVRDSTILLI